MVSFVGAGPGAVDLITVRGMNLISEADTIVYTGSLINHDLLNYAKAGADCVNSASLTLKEVTDILIASDKAGKRTVRLHTGDPSIYGAVKEQFDILEASGVEYEVCPGVSSFLGAAAALKAEYTLPSVSQTVIITRMEGRTPVPEEESISSLASHRASMAIFLSAGMLDTLIPKLIEHYGEGAPSAIVYKATWEDQKIIRAPLKKLAALAKAEGISKTAIVLCGGFLDDEYALSMLYHPEFSHGFRQGATK